MSSPRDILAGAAEVNGAQSRVDRRNSLNTLRHRVEEWLETLDNRADGGPSFKEMERIIADLESHIRAMRNYDKS